MERVNRILKQPIWKQSLQKNKIAEKERIFCKHNIEHFLDVGRIAYIKSLEQNLNIKKDVIYAAALLHDIGKFLQYLDGTPHEIASSDLAKDILKECGYLEGECDTIVKAILEHRKKPTHFSSELSRILYESDKISRNCMFCPANAQCNWADDKKNQEIIY